MGETTSGGASAPYGGRSGAHPELLSQALSGFRGGARRRQRIQRSRFQGIRYARKPWSPRRRGRSRGSWSATASDCACSRSTRWIGSRARATTSASTARVACTSCARRWIGWPNALPRATRSSALGDQRFSTCVRSRRSTDRPSPHSWCVCVTGRRSSRAATTSRRFADCSSRRRPERSDRGVE